MARKRKQKPAPRARSGPWEALGISSSTYYRRQRAEKRAKHDKQPPKPLDFDRAGFLQDQLKETNSALTQQDFEEAHAAQAVKLRDAADTALVEQFLWEVERVQEAMAAGVDVPVPKNWLLSGRTRDALYRVLKDGKGE